MVELQDDRLATASVRLFLKRDDLINAEIPGNKWRKLKYNLAAARDLGATTLLTFGGAYSNHIRATSAAGMHFGFDTIGVIRGEEHLPLNESLRYAVSCGMRLTYLDRTSYREQQGQAVIDDLERRFGPFYLLPEGGTNELAVRGCREILTEPTPSFDTVYCPCGTGGTLAGLASAAPDGVQVIGVSALKGGGFLVDDVRRLQSAAFGAESTNWAIDTEHHFGGFAKRNATLNAFIDDFRERHTLTLEWVYVAKMMCAIFDHIDSGRIRAGSRVLAIITG